MNTAAQLIDIWSRVLRCPQIAPDSDFFELGGDSLAAVGLFLEIERRLDRKLPITVIYDAPTVASLAELIEGEVNPQHSHFVPLKSGDDTAPLYIVHGLGGTVMELGPLGKLIDTNRAVYGIQARGLDGSEKPLESVAEMADLYTSLIRERQPHGPYFLGGYSFGGLIAMEVARRLGPESVGQLLLLDSFATPKTWPLRCRVQVRFRRAIKQMRARMKRPPRETLTYILKKAVGHFARRTPQQAAAARAEYVNNWLGAVDPNLPLPLKQTRIASDAALFAFAPSCYPGKATFLRASRPGAVFPANVRRVYCKTIADLEVRTVAGDHLSILQENAPELAGKISDFLSQATAS